MTSNYKQKKLLKHSFIITESSFYLQIQAVSNQTITNISSRYHVCPLSVSPTVEHKQNCHKLSTISKTPTLCISTSFLTHIYNDNFRRGKPSMLTLPEKKNISIFTILPDKLLCGHCGYARPFSFHGIFLLPTISTKEGAFPWFRCWREERP